MSGPEGQQIRDEVLAVLSLRAARQLTPAEQALADSATRAELELSLREATARRQALESLLHRLGTDPASVDDMELLVETNAPPAPAGIFDGLPEEAAVFCMMLGWQPRKGVQTALAALAIRGWSEQDRALCEERMRPWFPEGIEWPDTQA